ncbi:hypothetical protein [Ligilactobacillus salivarius]|uniref:DUF3168 domain-containing protein n=1 Tax=Ligilactobacillus salivarius TaxID=1624 RepID=A0A1V9QU83_9LACO|nr:hypothetical protein [Ligilactobacillus salivarius]OQQ84464.1 hypothetical protein B6U60_03960 [Ligilactobacillus salivarius]OQQ87063.1 hypothetical protein B6U59_04035 [Ligilactobacillus salivarius]
MKDALSEIYSSFLKETVIEKATLDGKKHHIYYYQEPDGALPQTFILIRPYKPPESSISMSDKSAQQEITVQIDVQSTVRMMCKELQSKVEEVLKPLGYIRINGQGLDEYFDETKHYVDARRYKLKTKLYETGY